MQLQGNFLIKVIYNSYIIFIFLVKAFLIFEISQYFIILKSFIFIVSILFPKLIFHDQKISIREHGTKKPCITQDFRLYNDDEDF